MSRLTYAILILLIAVTAIELTLMFVLRRAAVNAALLIGDAVLLWGASMRNYLQRKEDKPRLMRSTCVAVAIVCFAISQIIASQHPGAIGAALAIIGGVLMVASVIPIVTAQRTP